MRESVGSGKKSRRRRGSFSFEWIVLISLLVIGVIGGLSAVRNALLCELKDVADCIQALDCCPDCCCPVDPPPPPPPPPGP